MNEVFQNDPDAEERHAAIQSITRCLRDFLVRDDTSKWPLQTLAPIAQLTFSAGAAFVVARPKFELDIIGSGELSASDSPNQDTGSYFWRNCNKGDPVMWSHIPEGKLRELGLALASRSSVMMARSTSLDDPPAPVSIIVWRIGGSRAKYADQAYQVWDREWFAEAASMVMLALDKRTRDTIHSEKVITRHRALREAVKQVLNVWEPQLIALHQLSERCPPEVKMQIRDCIDELDRSLNQVHALLPAPPAKP